MTFNSQIYTSVKQSERLLSLGLKKETADMILTEFSDGSWRPTMTWIEEPNDYDASLYPEFETNDIPAWSLHRLIEMMPKNIAIDGDAAYPLQIQKRSDGKWCIGYQGWYDCVGDLYDSVIWIYQLLISEGYIDEEFCNKG